MLVIVVGSRHTRELMLSACAIFGFILILDYSWSLVVDLEDVWMSIWSIG